MKIKAVLLIVFLSFSTQAQTVVRKDGTSTGADAQVRDLKAGKSSGQYLNLDNWRIGVQIPAVIFDGSLNDPNASRSFIGVAPHLTVEQLSSIPAIKWKGALGLSSGDALGEFSQTGAYLAAGIRLDFNSVDFFFYEQSRSLEFMAETILDVDPKYMLTVNVYQSIQLFDAATFDFVFGTGIATVSSWESPALQLRFGVGVGFGGIR